MAADVFLDTNVLLTAVAPARMRHTEALQALDAAGTSGLVSGQVLREFLVVSTRPTEANGLGMELLAALHNVDVFLRRFRVLDEDAAVSRRLHGLLSEVPCTGKQVHDANIVATMLRHDVRELLTLNARDFQRFSGHISVREL